MRKKSIRPGNLIAAVDESISWPMAMGMGVQHCFAMSSTLVLAALLASSVSDSVEIASNLVQISMIAAGLGTILQSVKRGPVGSGYLCPNLAGPAFFPASLLAAKTGGLSLVFGMTLLSGVFQAILSRLIHKLRAFLPPEVTGVIVSMVGISLVGPGVSSMAGIAPGDDVASLNEVIVGLVTLVLMFGFTVWGTGLMRLYCVLGGIGFGYAISFGLSVLPQGAAGTIANVNLFDWPDLHLPTNLSFDSALLIPFLIAGLASTVKAVGDLSTAQKINDDDWAGPEMGSIRGGVLADALSVMSAGLLGGLGPSTSSSNVGVSLATGVTSRFVGFSAGAIFIAAAFIPALSYIFVLMPPPVKGAIMVYAACFMIVTGMQLVMTRLMDARKIFVVGASIILGLSVDVLPELYADLHPALGSLATSSMSLATVTAIVLNLVFRIGISRRATLDLTTDDDPAAEVIRFLQARGGAWGARRDVIDRATTALMEFVEVVSPAEGEDGRVRINAHFDQFRLDLYLLYSGEPLTMPEARPEPHVAAADLAQMRLLSGFIIRNAASKAETTRRGNLNMTHLVFEH